MRLRSVYMSVTNQIKLTLICCVHSRRVTFVLVVWLVETIHEVTEELKKCRHWCRIKSPSSEAVYNSDSDWNYTLFFVFPFMWRQSATSTCGLVKSSWIQMKSDSGFRFPLSIVLISLSSLRNHFGYLMSLPVVRYATDNETTVHFNVGNTDGLLGHRA